MLSKRWMPCSAVANAWCVASPPLIFPPSTILSFDRVGEGETEGEREDGEGMGGTTVADTRFSLCLYVCKWVTHCRKETKSTHQLHIVKGENGHWLYYSASVPAFSLACKNLTSGHFPPFPPSPISQWACRGALLGTKAKNTPHCKCAKYMVSIYSTSSNIVVSVETMPSLMRVSHVLSPPTALRFLRTQLVI